MWTRRLLLLGIASSSAMWSGCTAPCRQFIGCGHVGCASTCGLRAGDTWDCDECEGPRLCPCTGPCTGPCGGCGPACGASMDPACGVEATCGMDALGCEPSCDVACGDCCSGSCGHCTPVRSFLALLFQPLCGCGGCDKELYWSEWHNDPPRCCDPCDRHGNWIGPSAAYRAPYDHPYGYADQGPTDGAPVVARPASKGTIRR